MTFSSISLDATGLTGTTYDVEPSGAEGTKSHQRVGFNIVCKGWNLCMSKLIS